MRSVGIGTSSPLNLKYVADAAALAALTGLIDGELVVQIDTNEVYSWDAGGAAFILVATPAAAAISVSDSTSIDLTLLAGDISGAVLPAGVDHNALANTHNLTTDVDHDSITNAHNLSTDIDHNGLTNTHNLTTDIDHDALTNFVADEHIDWTNASDNLETSGDITTSAGAVVTDVIAAVTDPSVSEIFTGAGLDDIALDASGYVGPSCQLRVVIIGTGTPDTYRLYMGNATNGTILLNNQPVSAVPADVFNGLLLSFGATTGHTNSNYWSITLVGSGAQFKDHDGNNTLKVEEGIISNGSILLGKTPEDDSLILQQITSGAWESLKKFALRQLADGTTYLNAAAGKALEFLVDGTRVMRFISGRFSIGTATAIGKMHVVQESSSGAIPVEILEQADTDESFIDFRGTSAADVSASITTRTVATIAGYVKIEINGATYWMPYYNEPTA